MARGLLQNARLALTAQTPPSTAATGEGIIGIDASGNLYKVDAAGNLMIIVAAGDFTLTIPATGVAALLGVAQTFTGALTLDKFLIGAGADLTIASGVVTVTHFMHRIDTEAAGATDDLDTINGAGARQMLVIEAVSSARTVVVKHGTGNVFLNGAVDFSLTHVRDKLWLMSNVAGTEWHQISSSDNSA